MIDAIILTFLILTIVTQIFHIFIIKGRISEIDLLIIRNNYMIGIFEEDLHRRQRGDYAGVKNDE